jgi:D-alanine-D-alanine ligase
MVNNKTVVVLYNSLSEDASKDVADVILQADAVCDALEKYRCNIFRYAFCGDFGALSEYIEKIKPDFIFNLVEEVSGKGRLGYIIPAYLESKGIPYTGNSAEAMILSTDKLAAKKILSASGLPTAPWVEDSDEYGFEAGEPYIIKIVSEDGSVGITEDSVVKCGDLKELRTKLKKAENEFGNPVFAEKYIEGREINVSILGGKSCPAVLTPCEIKFHGFENKIKIFDYRAKWENESLEYKGIESDSGFEKKDDNLIGKLKKIALGCWKIFGLNGYARVDFRIDACGRPFVLDINANPCITPGDSSFTRSAESSGLKYCEVVEAIASATI